MKDPYYITTPIYYVNAEPHLGHAYSTLVADVLHRFHHLLGMETYFLTGTDEHGDKIVEAARKAGLTPKEYVDGISAQFRSLWPRLAIGNRNFIRTTDPHHQGTVQRILSLVHDRGDIYFSEYEGRYCVGCERFYTDRELVDGRCPDHLTEPVTIREANYFFRMSRYQDWLIGHIQANPDFIRPERYRNEVLSFLKEPLDDLCISRPKRRLTWGITLPFDADYVTYVWFDALINYVSALGYPDGPLFRTFWPAAQHVIAKDILKPHGIYWPCMLKAAGIPPYRHLNVHGYWNIAAGKMSKSLGNVVQPLHLIETYGLDAFRYFLLREMVFGLDADFSEQALVTRINADLANDFGNLVSRTLTMLHKYFQGTLPEFPPGTREDEALESLGASLPGRYTDFMERLEFHKALMGVWDLVSLANRYIDTMAPWVLARSDPERLKGVLCRLYEVLRTLSVLLWPFMPGTCERLQGMLRLPASGEALTLAHLGKWGETRPAGALDKAMALFPRIETKPKEEARKEVMTESSVTFEEFQRMDIRTGTILEAEAIPKSQKLVKLTVDIGEVRTIVAGIKGLAPEAELKGKQVTVLANLKPAKLMGVESQGMVLAAQDEAGLHLITPEGQTRPGSKVK